MRKAIPSLLAAGLIFAATACSNDSADPATTGTPPAGTETVVETEQPTEEVTETETATETESNGSGESEGTESEAQGEGTGEQYKLDWDGVPPFVLGATDMVKQGAMELEPECNIYVSTEKFSKAGIQFQLLQEGEEPKEDAPLEQISVTAPEGDIEPVSTKEGAKPGMTFAELKEIYPDVTTETKEGDGGPFKLMALKKDGKEMLFLNDKYSEEEIADDDKVASIILQEENPEVRGGC